MNILNGQIIIAPSAATDSGMDAVRLRNAGGDDAAAIGISLPGSGDR